jgi:hypothetical protein
VYLHLRQSEGLPGKLHEQTQLTKAGPLTMPTGIFTALLVGNRPQNPPGYTGSFHRLVITTSRYSEGMSIVPSPDRLYLFSKARMSLARASLPASSRAANALRVGP